MMAAAMVMTALMLAQTPAPAGEAPTFTASVIVGGGTTWDDEGSIGPGWSTGGAIAWRFLPRLAATFEVERLPHHRETPGLRFDGRALFASAGVRYRFRRAGAAPFAGGGVGVARYSGDLLVRFEPPPTTVRRRSTSTFVYMVGGVDVPAGSRVFVAPE